MINNNKEHDDRGDDELYYEDYECIYGCGYKWDDGDFSTDDYNSGEICPKCNSYQKQISDDDDDDRGDMSESSSLAKSIERFIWGQAIPALYRSDSKFRPDRVYQIKNSS